METSVKVKVPNAVKEHASPRKLISQRKGSQARALGPSGIAWRLHEP